MSDTCRLTFAVALVLARTRESWSLPATPAEGCFGLNHQEVAPLGLRTRQDKDISAQATGLSTKE